LEGGSGGKTKKAAKEATNEADKKVELEASDAAKGKYLFGSVAHERATAFKPSASEAAFWETPARVRFQPVIARWSQSVWRDSRLILIVTRGYAEPNTPIDKVNSIATKQSKQELSCSYIST